MLPRAAAGLAVSNIAWEPEQDDAVAVVMRNGGCTGVEIAPTKVHPRPLEATSKQVAAYRDRWVDRGLPIVAMQSLLFGRGDLQLFGSAGARAELLDYLRGIIDLGAALGASALVFGSPKNRQRGALPLADANQIATAFFRAVSSHAAPRGVVVCLEPNPPAYGCDFVTDTAQAAELSRRVNAPGIGVNGDLGAMTMNGESPAVALAAVAGALSHFHVSEPMLAEIGTGSARIGDALAGLDAIGYAGWVSLEMRAPPAVDTAVEAVRRALEQIRSARTAGC